MDFIITIDTEADNQWVLSEKLTTENARFIRRFQALCDRFGLKPTYLCTYEMVSDRHFQDVVGPYQQSGCAEIGAHLHPWSTPPFAEDEPPAHICHGFPSELSTEAFDRKISMLTQLIAETFGNRPTSYRAGRYGFCAEHIDVLLKLGYVVDCSVIPYISHASQVGYPGGAGGPDYRRARPGAYVLSRDDCTQAGDSGLLEVPVTILFPHWPLRSWGWMQRRLVGNPRAMWVRLLGRLGQGPQWLRPWHDVTSRQLTAVFLAARRLGLPCVEMMFHSSELMPGGSPMFADRASIERLFKVFVEVFSNAVRAGARGVTLTEFARKLLGREGADRPTSL